jgi:hypothetical protein
MSLTSPDAPEPQAIPAATDIAALRAVVRRGVT